MQGSDSVSVWTRGHPWTAIIGVTVVIVVVVLLEALTSVEWGTVGGWVSGLAAAGALAVSMYVLGLETQRRREELQADRERQARSVAAWVDSSQASHEPGRMIIHWVAGNSSTEPVYDVHVGAQARSEPDWHVAHLEVLGPGVVTSPERAVVPAPLREVRGSMLHVPPRLRVSFTDSAGRKWVREFDGALIATR